MTSARIHEGDALEVLRSFEPGSFTAAVTDPPYGLGLLGERWDLDELPTVELWREVLRVLKPGATLLAFGSPRTFHRLACAIEDAGFAYLGCLGWIYGQGFPKNLDVSKAIDRRRDDRAEVLEVTTWVREARDRAGLSNRAIDQAFGFRGMAGHWTTQKSQPTIPTPEQVPKLLELLGVEDPPERIQELLVELNGRKGTLGPGW